ncbi:MAG: DUF4139 domain-containing protein [Candidatus Omnitrophica bacterium]|nr:DUF4139 domain-containing protein [Candidatus Omnitrophota bacterium]
MKKIIGVIGIVVLLSSFVSAEEMRQKEISLTIYNQNFGLVKDIRYLSLKKGLNIIRFVDVAREIDATSVSFKSLRAPESCIIQEQNFEYDLISRNKLLEKYLDQEIILERTEGTTEETYDKWATLGKGSRQRKEVTPKIKRVKAILLSTKGGMVVKIGDEIYLNPLGRVILPALPEGLITKPTLLWELLNEKPGMHTVEVTYLTNGINWKADYISIVNRDDKKIDLNGWVTIDNKSGATYKNAGLKLIAGEVHRVEERPKYKRDLMLREAKAGIAAPQFKEKAFFEYHLYTLQRKTTLKDNQTKQISLFTATEIPTKKLFTYDGAIYRGWWRSSEKEPCNKKVAVSLEFKNEKKYGLGIPLPKGKIRVYKKDVDGSLEFIGEDQIDHTPKNEKVKLFLGNAFDIVGERKCTEHRKISSRVYQNSYEITLSNHKKEDVKVIVIEHLYGDWQILSESQPHTKKDAFTIEYPVSIPKDGKATVTYTALYKF